MEYGIEYDAKFAHLDFMAKHAHENEQIETNIPIRVTIGVTIALCGVFLLFIPIPICQLWAPRIIGTGATIAAEGCMDRMEENRKK
jgi:protein-S-isoprenylcysteine O-methyltransferase Ste14